LVGLLSGISPKDGRLFLASAGPMGGGWGAKHNGDGMNAVVCMNDGDTHNHPVEQMEAKFPMLFERHALREDSGGAGKFRGGLGTEQIIRALAPLTVNLQIDRVHCRPWGLAGGGDGYGNEVRLRLAGKEIGDLPNAKVLMQRLKAGDAFIVRSGGGGGFGPARERERSKVAYDVQQGYVSIQAASQIYGIEFDRAEKTLEAL
jgi:N-methylhydantoinase B